jgi:alpha-1,3-rhamnosyl/mannosyltransferase
VRVLVDTSYAARGRSGTAVYVERLTAALRALPDVEVVEARQPRRLRRGRAGRRWNPARTAVNAALDAAWLARGLPRAAREARADVVHHPLPAFSRRIGVPQVVTVHDVAFARLPHRFRPLWRRLAERAHARAVRRAAAVVCVSEATAADAARLLGAPPGRIVVAPHGPGQDLPRVPRAAEPRHFLYVGDAEPRKGVPALLAAHERYRAGRDDALPLVLAGAAGGTDPGPGELARLLAEAVALVHPSELEGFGLTLLEAMAAGVPVAAVRNPAVAEVSGDAALLVDGQEGLADALARLHEDGALRARLAAAGPERAARFSWAEAARLHRQAYTLALSP